MTLTDIKLAGVVSLLSAHLVAIWDIVIVSEGLGKKFLIVFICETTVDSWCAGVCMCVCVCVCVYLTDLVWGLENRGG